MAKGSGNCSCLPTKSLKEQTKTCRGHAKFESYLPEGKLKFMFFLALLTGVKIKARADSKPNESPATHNAQCTVF